MGLLYYMKSNILLDVRSL